MIGDPLTWRVRECGADDADALALVGAASFLEGFAGFISGPSMVAHCRGAHSEATYRAYLEGGARAFLGEAATPAGENGAPIGYALLTRPELPGAVDGDIELKRIYLLARAQGSGLAGALLEACIAASEGHQRLLLGTHPDNVRAIAFYEKHGFVGLGTRQFNVGGTIFDDIVMARDLALSSRIHP